MTEPNLLAWLDEALAGRRLKPKEARRLADDLRQVVRALEPDSGGPDAILASHLRAAALLLEAQAERRR